MTGRIIVVANQKGGVGKTTTAVNLAASLAVAEKKCLVVDCDPQGNATTGLGLVRAQVHMGLYDVLLGDGSYLDAITQTAVTCLDVVGSNSDLIGVEMEMASIERREYRLRERVFPLRAKYDYIFMDCPPSLGLLTVNALTAADSVLVPLQCEYYALEGLSQLLETINAIRKGLNPSLMLEGILLTMHDARNNLSVQVEEEVRSHFKSRVFKTVIPRNVRLSEAPSYGKPILFYDVKSKGAQSYLALAREILSRGENGNDEA